MANNEPMTDERLQTIRERIYGDSAWEHDAGIANDVLLDRLALLHEVERQRAVIAAQQAKLAAMREEHRQLTLTCDSLMASLEQSISTMRLVNKTDELLEQARACLAAHQSQLAAETLEREGE